MFCLHQTALRDQHFAVLWISFHFAFIQYTQHTVIFLKFFFCFVCVLFILFVCENVLCWAITNDNREYFERKFHRFFFHCVYISHEET
jgi:hypothetical protein